MNRTTIVNRIVQKCGQLPLSKFTLAGPAYGLAYNDRMVVWALAPIDDELDERFADFLVDEWRKKISPEE